MLTAIELVPFVNTIKKFEESRSGYEAVLAESGRPFTPLSAPYVPKEGWAYNSGGEGNQQDDPLRHFLAWEFYGDQNALQSGFNILSYLADHTTEGEHTYQNGHGQRHPNFGLYALKAMALGDTAMAEKLIAAEVKLYSLNLGSKEWTSLGPSTFRPGCRFLSTTVRLCHDVPLLQKAGLIHPDQFPGQVSPDAVLARLIEWAKRWFWEMQISDKGTGWAAAPGLYRYDDDERDWLYWAQSTSDSEESHLTAFMHYSLFPRDVAVALTWLDGIIDGETKNLWARRLRDMSTWALAVAYDPVTGLAKRAQDWSPDILAERGPFRLYANADTGERTHSLAVTIASARASKEKRKKELVNCLELGMKLPPGEVDEGLVIAAQHLEFGS